MDEYGANLAPYVIRFTWVLVLMSGAAALIVGWFQLQGNSGLVVGIIMAAAISAGQKFLEDKGRVFSTSEKLRMSTHCLLVSWVVSLLVLAALLMFLQVEFPDPFLVVRRLSPMALGMTVVGISLLCFGLFYLVYGFLINKVYLSMKKRGEI